MRKSRVAVAARAKLGAGAPAQKTIDLGGGVQLELVLIPGGEFQMGSEGGDHHEQPIHKVTISKAFYMGKFEVTQEHWKAVMGTDPSNFKGAKNPVEQVSWDDCQEFLERLNKLKKGYGKFRLPTEAEWEYACRAGSSTKYSYGDDEAGLGEYAWYDGNSNSSTHPVGEKKPNAFGLYDMHGNVWEWCQDWYGKYKGDAQKDPVGPAIGQCRVMRGGSWASVHKYCPSAYRGNYYILFLPVISDVNIGFRVVCIAGAI